MTEEGANHKRAVSQASKAQNLVCTKVGRIVDDWGHFMATKRDLYIDKPRARGFSMAYGLLTHQENKRSKRG